MARPSSFATRFMSEPTQSLPSAGLLRRLAALVYDVFLLFGLMVVPLFLLTAIRSHSAFANESVAHDLPPIAPAPVMLLYIVCVVGGFYGYFWRKSGQTLGMQAWRIRVDNRSGGRPNLRQCFIRGIGGLISLSLFGIGFLWLLIDRQHSAWHDRLSSTRVVVLPKK